MKNKRKLFPLRTSERSQHQTRSNGSSFAHRIARREPSGSYAIGSKTHAHEKEFTQVESKVKWMICSLRAKATFVACCHNSYSRQMTLLQSEATVCHESFRISISWNVLLSLLLQDRSRTVCRLPGLQDTPSQAMSSCTGFLEKFRTSFFLRQVQ